ncbi:glutathione S-transferase [Marinomonas agarivorans]|nr:glutathione S-transferase [Marinomonas agarivorans]
MPVLPILYSFRRCPYAMRARYTLMLLNIPVTLREVELKNKPSALLELGGRTTVPQLIDIDGQRYEESMDIIRWAVGQAALQEHASILDLNSFYPVEKKVHIEAWLFQNDLRFKPWLDRYKYADRYPEKTATYYRTQAERFLRRLERKLATSTYLMGETLTLADVIVFPFIRQFRGVDQNWFEGSHYACVKRWLNDLLDSKTFIKVMHKYPTWKEGDEETVFQ